MKKITLAKFGILVATILLLFLAPSSIGRPNQAETEAVVVAMGVDKESDIYEVSIQIIQPAEGLSYTDNLVISSQKGKSIALAIDALALNLGKEIGFAHCKVLILSEEVCKDNIINVIDYFLRTGLLGSTMSVVNTDKKAKDTLQASSEGINKQINSVQYIMEYNKLNVHAAETHIKSLLIDYLNPHSTSLMSTLSILDEGKDEEASGSGGGTEGGGGSGGQSAEQKPKELVNKGQTSVFKSGKKIGSLNEEQVRGYKWMLPQTVNGSASIEDVTSKHYDNAKITAALIDRQFSDSCKIINNIPTLTYNLRVFLRINEIIQEGKDVLLDSNTTYFDDALKQKFKTKIEAQVADAVDFAKTNKADIMNFYDIFNKADTRAWKKFLSTLSEGDSYLNHVNVITNVEVLGRI